MEEIFCERLGNIFKSINISQEKYSAIKIIQLTHHRRSPKVATIQNCVIIYIPIITVVRRPENPDVS
jgi:hypothetical protein